MPLCGHIVHWSSPGPQKRNIVICVCCNFKIAMRLTSLCLRLLKLLWLKKTTQLAKFVKRMCITFRRKRKKNMVTENLLENWHPHCCICLSLNWRRHPDLYVFYSLFFHFSSLITDSLFSPQDFFLFLFRFFSSLSSRRKRAFTLLSLKIKSLLMLNLSFYSNGPSIHLTAVVVTRLQKVAVVKYR